MTHLPLPPEALALLDFARAARVEHGFAHLDADGVPDAGKPSSCGSTAA